MAKKLALTAVSLLVSAACFAQVYGSREEAMKAAKKNCAETGQTMRAGSNNSHTGKVEWSNSSSKSTQNNGAQNNWSAGGSVSVPISPVKINGSAGYERKGSQTNTSSQSENSSSGSYYYKCE